MLEEGCFTSSDTQGTSDVKTDRHLYDSSLPVSYLRRNRTETESKAKVSSDNFSMTLISNASFP